MLSERRPNLPQEILLKARLFTSLWRGAVDAHLLHIGANAETEQGHPSASSAKDMVTSFRDCPSGDFYVVGTNPTSKETRGITEEAKGQ